MRVKDFVELLHKQLPYFPPVLRLRLKIVILPMRKSSIHS